jgi:hypothetical protein
MHIAKRKEIIGLNESAVCVDHRRISVTYRPAVSTTEMLNVSPDNFRIISSYVTVPPTLITLRTKTCTCWKRSSTQVDTAGGEVIHIQRINTVNRLLFQMQTSIITMLLFSSCVASVGLENLLRLSNFIADIYQQFPHSCIFIIESEAEKGEN